MGVTDPSTKMLPVSLQLCHISSSSTGLFPRADWEMMVDLATNASPVGTCPVCLQNGAIRVVLLSDG